MLNCAALHILCLVGPPLTFAQRAVNVPPALKLVQWTLGFREFFFCHTALIYLSILNYRNLHRTGLLSCTTTVGCCIVRRITRYSSATLTDSLRRPSSKPALSLLSQKTQASPDPVIEQKEIEAKDLDVEALIEPIAEEPGSPSALPSKESFVAQLFVEQAVPLVKYLTARFRNAAEAQDIAQEAWLRIFRLGNPEQLSNAKAFLFQTASNLAIDRARRGKLEQKYLDQELGLAEPALAPSMERTVVGTQQLELVEQALLSLPLKCRQAFVAHRNRGLPYAEIARQLGVSTSMVEKYIIQALRHLRATLK
jgi:RNA polymerase sigma factor (sigma-70 family)